MSARRRYATGANAPFELSEKHFQQAVLDFAAYNGWKLRYHTLTSIGSQPGFPDLVLVRAPRLIFAELKTEKGRLTIEQSRWLEALWDCGQEAFCWRPSDWPAIERVLAREPAKAAR